jgi:hypothetical protein
VSDHGPEWPAGADDPGGEENPSGAGEPGGAEHPGGAGNRAADPRDAGGPNGTDAPDGRAEASGAGAGATTSSMRRMGRRIRDGERPVDLDRVIRFMGYRYATAVLVLLALLALYGVAAFSRPSGAARAQGGQAPVTSAVLGCPDPGGTRLSVLTPGPTGRPGRADVTTTRDGAAKGAVTASGTAWSDDVGGKGGSSSGGGNPGTTDAYTVRATGALAGGLEVEQTSADTKGADRGLAGVRCSEPGNDMWFLGPGPVDAKDVDLYLTNVDEQPAAVDVLALSGEGPLDTTDGRGTTVGPHTGRVIPIGKTAEGLGDIVKTARILALHVRVTTGRVAAAVRVRVGGKQGVDWVPVTAPPALGMVVPGVPGGSGRRQLLVAVPGEADAQVKVQVITSTGTFAPEGQDTLDAPAQTVTPLDLEQALSGKAAAIRLSSDRPIIAGFTADMGADVAYGAATEPLGGGGAVADNRSGAVVVLTAPEGGATVRVGAVTGQGAVGAPQEVTVAAGRTVEVPLKAPAGADKGFGALLTPRPGSGPVYAARVLSMRKGSDRLFTVLPVVPALTWVARPPVGDSLTSMIP